MFEVNLVRNRFNLYQLQCGYDQELVSNIKKLSGDQREFDPEKKQWTLKPSGLYNIILLYRGRKDIFFKFIGDGEREIFTTLIKRQKTKIEKKVQKIRAVESFNAEILKIKEALPELTKDFDYTTYLKEGVIPMQHQIEGAYFAWKLIETKRSSLLAMDLGTGKSLTSLLAAQLDESVKKVLFIVPANLKLNIQNEVYKFTDEKCYVLKTIKDKKNGGYRLTKYRRNKGAEIEECKFIVTNYEYFSASKFDANERITPFKLHEVDLIIFDEAHNISNKKSNRSINIKKSFDGLVEKKIALTATPLKNNVTKFFPLLKILKPEEFSNESKFFIDYCGMYYDQMEGWKQREGDHTDFEGLYKKIQSFTFRVKKKDVLKNLPPIMINKIVLEMTDVEAKEYADIEKGFSKVDWSNGNLIDTDLEDSDSALTILTRLRQYTASLKTKKALELIKELNDMGEKVILFDAFKKPLYALKDLLGPETKLYTGDQTAEAKQDLVDEFQDKNSPLKNLLISLMAGNAGITLTEASNVIQTTLSYVPSENSQAWGRSHRIGQLLQVIVYLLIVADTVDEDIYDILQEKEKTIKAVIDGEEHVDNAEVSVIGDVFKKMREKHLV